MSDFNDIGISRQLDWQRIQKLLSIGLFSAVLHLVGDLILGWGVEDESLCQRIHALPEVVLGIFHACGYGGGAATEYFR